MAPESVFDQVPELLREPLERRGGGVYTGRFQVRAPKWLDNPDDLHATAALSVRDIVFAAENRLIWTDQVVQRGIKPGREKEAAVELCLDDGYPDTSLYQFYPDKADAIADRLLAGEPGLRLSPLVWNLRSGGFQAAVHTAHDEEQIYLYRGRIYLPDGHHRHQGILKAHRLWTEAPQDYPAFDPERQFTVDIYFMSRQDEAEYFFQKNTLPQQVERSKSFDLTEQDPLSVLAKRVIEHAPSLGGNVNRVTDRLAASNPQVITLSTLREVMKSIISDDGVTEDEIAELAPRLGSFWEELARVRSELGHLDVAERRNSRRQSMAGQAVLMYGYAELMRRFLLDVASEGEEAAIIAWQTRLKHLAPSESFHHDSGWNGDFFDRDNPLWADLGVLQTTKSGGVTVSNTRQTRDQVAKALVERLGL